MVLEKLKFKKILMMLNITSAAPIAAFPSSKTSFTRFILPLYKFARNNLTKLLTLLIEKG